MADPKPTPPPAPVPAPEAAPEKPATVRVRALQAHTTAGVAHDVDDVYDVAADLVDTLATQGKAVRADP